MFNSTDVDMMPKTGAQEDRYDLPKLRKDLRYKTPLESTEKLSSHEMAQQK
jgi:hypothetical protein